MSNKLRVVYRTGAAHKAHLLKNILADYDIASHVADINVATEIGGSSQAISVSVSDDDFELVSRIVESFDRHLDSHSDADHRANDQEAEAWDESEFPHVWVDWPKCRRCDAPRETGCSYCNTIGITFELADQEWAEEDTTEEGEPGFPLLICHTCSEPFEPKFYRHCAQCNLDLGHGEPAPDLELTPSEGFLSPAVFGWLLIGIAVLILLIMSST